MAFDVNSLLQNLSLNGIGRSPSTGAPQWSMGGNTPAGFGLSGNISSQLPLWMQQAGIAKPSIPAYQTPAQIPGSQTANPATWPGYAMQFLGQMPGQLPNMSGQSIFAPLANGSANAAPASSGPPPSGYQQTAAIMASPGYGSDNMTPQQWQVYQQNAINEMAGGGNR